ncbi:hypothetical protein A1O3_04918 [Capronia epimyces CBS 606.96]|uniref:FAD-binding FR-type domain-containing protein n=1 Tax=Capronia epimyces CBS 606.96 TaxID=1182542 RepID=W9Y4V0_9EURO|nr:uncharacterized protein A1O3_04918 [Capronia epimyces CBS 606.96]EXJ84251.1 hypothetical protein A1O3_04918 [Capronia epimyces CBS 606.96]
MDVPLLVFALASLLGPALCYDPAIECINGIRTDIAEFTFAGGEASGYWVNLCSNNLSVHSMWAATKLYCTQHEIEAGSKMLGEYCLEYALVELTPYSEVLPSLTDAYIASLPVVEYSDIDATKIWNQSVLLSKDFYTAGRRTTSVFQNSYTIDQRYGWAVYGFWGGILLIGIVNRLFTHFFHARRTPTRGDVEERRVKLHAPRSLSVFGTAHHWVRTNLIIPAAFGSHHQRLLWWCTVPTRMETVIVVSFWILNLVLCCVSYEIFVPNLYYTRALQIWRYVADRTGIICYANLPILWMFSGRNNIFLWLTGWSFSTFNIFHRHVARIATVQAIVHSIAYTALEADYDQLAESRREKYWYMGGMATIAMGLLLFFSSIYFRRHSYEIFLLIHIALSVVTIVGLFYHTAIFDGEYDPYLWPLVAIWLFDRFARIVRLVYCNLRVRLSSAPIATTTTATYDQAADLIRLEVTPGSGLLKPGPGQHYFIYQPAKWKGWENHPFTLASWSVQAGSKEVAVEPSPNHDHVVKAMEAEIKAAAKTSPSQDSSSATSVSSEKGQAGTKEDDGRYRLTFFVRPFSSWTMRLRDECLKSPTGLINPRAFIEGPYGETSPLHTYENVVFILGGTGISGALPYLQEHVIRAASQSSSAAAATGESKVKGTRTRDITFVWTTKQSAMIRDIAARELRPFLAREDIHCSFYATSRKESSETIKAAEIEVSSNHTAEVGITYGRPNIRETVRGVIDEVHEAGSAGGKIAILTCGPAAMADEARAAVHEALKNGKRGVDYFEETFG